MASAQSTTLHSWDEVLIFVWHPPSPFLPPPSQLSVVEHPGSLLANLRCASFFFFFNSFLRVALISCVGRDYVDNWFTPSRYDLETGLKCDRNYPAKKRETRVAPSCASKGERVGNVLRPAVSFVVFHYHHFHFLLFLSWTCDQSRNKPQRLLRVRPQVLFHIFLRLHIVCFVWFSFARRPLVGRVSSGPEFFRFMDSFPCCGLMNTRLWACECWNCGIVSHQPVFLEMSLLCYKLDFVWFLFIRRVAY